MPPPLRCTVQFPAVPTRRDTFERVAKMEAEESEEVRVEMSFLEIYIENVYDLLAATDAVRSSLPPENSRKHAREIKEEVTGINCSFVCTGFFRLVALYRFSSQYLCVTVFDWTG